MLHNSSPKKTMTVFGVCLALEYIDKPIWQKEGEQTFAPLHLSKSAAHMSHFADCQQTHADWISVLNVDTCKNHKKERRRRNNHHVSHLLLQPRYNCCKYGGCIVLISETIISFFWLISLWLSTLIWQSQIFTTCHRYNIYKSSYLVAHFRI